jgi:protease I
MKGELKGMRAAILVANGFEQVEMTKPREALEQAGAKTEIISPARGEVQGWNHQDKGDKFRVDADLNSADVDDYDALLLPRRGHESRSITQGPADSEVCEAIF